ncbi:OmpA family protein [Rhodoferax sp.]|uniref:OmpA family protein n=1 Tax=Rhodoferax sp. TaxID=50421 RepID=UPI002ACE5068|nr:OmpA family protein [Rhodoferax sp.]MDZ7921706.1 OmpA family protein [Rhodoferax sp.]
MLHLIPRALAPLVLGALLSACAPLNRITLLPEADGRATALEVRTSGGLQVLDQPYAVAAVQRTGNVDRDQTTAAEVQKRHGALLALQPPGVQRFVLQFEPGTATLTPESQAQLPTILAQARALPGGELVVVGHTDRTGSPQANDMLSLQRAQAVRALLVEQGFQPELIEAVGRGEREPVVPTEANVDEPRNRRAEILIR